MEVTSFHDCEEDNFIELSTNDFDTYVLHPWAWKKMDSQVPMYVYIVPLLSIVVLIINALVIFVFIRERMLSTTNVILIAIAVCDALTVLLPSPLLVYLYSTTDGPFIPYDLCRTWDYVTKNAPAITHTSSIWLTVFLAVHRYFCVCRPFLARRYFTKKRCLVAILIIWILATLFHLCRFIDTDYIIVHKVNTTHSVFIETVLSGSTENITCLSTHVNWLQGNVKLIYECVYYWFYIIFVITFPCVCLISTSFSLIKNLRRSDAMARENIAEEHVSKLRHRRSDRITKITIGVTCTVTLVELPVGIVLVLWTFSMIDSIKKIPESMLQDAKSNIDFKSEIIPEAVLGEVSVIINLIIYASFPVVFMLYCLMSSRFLNSIKELFNFKCISRHHNYNSSPQTPLRSKET